MPKATSRFRPGGLSVIAWPLICYLGFTLGGPLANGAHSRDDFWVHGAVVLGVVGALLAIWLVTRALWSRVTNQNRT